MTDYRTATLTDITARLAQLEALARDVEDPELADWVRKLSSLMRETQALASEVLRAADDNRGRCPNRPHIPSLG